MNHESGKAGMEMKDIELFFKKNDWNYEKIGDDVIVTQFKLHSRLKEVRIYISVRKEALLMRAVPPIGADEDNLEKVAEFITRANYGMIFGKFEMDYDDGEVSYTFNTLIDDKNGVTEDAINDNLDLVLAMMEKYGDGLAAVIMGFSEPVEAVKHAEKKEENTDKNDGNADGGEPDGRDS